MREDSCRFNCAVEKIQKARKNYKYDGKWVNRY